MSKSSEQKQARRPIAHSLEVCHGEEAGSGWGGAGGPSAAAKAKRLDPDLDVTILEAGEYVSFST